MNTTLAEALENVDLESGRTYRCKVKGHVVELRVLDQRPEAPDIPEEDVPLDAGFDLPAPQPDPRTIQRSKLIPLNLPDPPNLEELKPG